MLGNDNDKTEDQIADDIVTSGLGENVKAAPSGKVEVTQPESNSTVSESESEIPVVEKEQSQEIPYEELKKNYDELITWAQDIYSYSKVDPNNPENRTWDIDKIVEEAGYDPASLVTQGTPVKKPEEKEISPDIIPDEMVAQMQEDPKTFLENFQKKVAETAREETLKALEGRLAPIEKDNKAARVTKMVNGMREKHSDFKSYEPQIAKLAQSHPVKNARDLELLYLAAKGTGLQGTPSNNKGGNLAETTRSSGGSKAGEKEISADDKIFEDMKVAGDKPEKAETMKALFGKTRLNPLAGQIMEADIV